LQTLERVKSGENFGLENRKRKFMTNMISRKQVAELLHCSPMTVRRLERAGKLRSVHITSHMLRFKLEDVERLLEGVTALAPTQQ
jgi:excisionase family DNA binding protein